MTAYLNALPEPLYALFGTGYLGYTAARQWGKVKGVDRDASIPYLALGKFLAVRQAQLSESANRESIMKRLAALVLLPLLAAALAGCGSDRRQEDEMMRRVAQAEEAARKAEAAAVRAEDAAKLATGGSTVPESIYEEAPDSDETFGEGTEPVPLDG